MIGATSRLRLVLGAAALTFLTSACGDRANDRAAYEGCLTDGKKAGSKAAQATFESFEKTTFGYMQDASINVRIPYELAGNKGVHECSMVKQNDGSFKNQL
jgi:hypothetical protein